MSTATNETRAHPFRVVTDHDAGHAEAKAFVRQLRADSADPDLLYRFLEPVVAEHAVSQARLRGVARALQVALVGKVSV